MTRLLWRPMVAIVAITFVAAGFNYAVLAAGGTLIESVAATLAITLAGVIPLGIWIKRLVRAAGIPAVPRPASERIVLGLVTVAGLLIATGVTYASYAFLRNVVIEVPTGFALGCALAVLVVPRSIGLQVRAGADARFIRFNSRIFALLGVIFLIGLVIMLIDRHVESGLIVVHYANIAAYSVLIPMLFGMFAFSQRLRSSNA